MFDYNVRSLSIGGITFDTGYDKVDDTTEEIDYYRLGVLTLLMVVKKHFYSMKE